MCRTLPLLAVAGLVALAGCSTDPASVTSGGAPVTGTATTAQPGTTAAPGTTTTRGTTAPPATAPVEATGCPNPQWTTADQRRAGSSTDALYLVRVTRHECYDRVVFSINGPAATGYAVGYVPVVTADASGEPLPVPGAAVLQVVVRSPEQGADDGGHQPGRLLARTGDHLYPPARLADWPSLRAVRFAGSFEGQCTFAVGVRGKLPFRVSTTLDAADHIRLVVLDVAH